MKKALVMLSLVVTFFALSAADASTASRDTAVRVGLRYGSSVMSSANLEND